MPVTTSNPQSHLGKTVIIGVHAGGLGDQLAYSALPRLYKIAGAAEVLVSRKTNYGEKLARNPEAIGYVWKRNPYVDGLTDEPANVGETGWPPVAFFRAAKHAESPIDAVAKVHNLPVFTKDRKSRVVPPRPDLFHDLKVKADFIGKVVCDPHSISQQFSPAVFNDFVSFFCSWNDVNAADVIVLCNRHSGSTSLDLLPRSTRYHVEDIYDYTDIIGSARSFLVTESGGQSVAAAVRDAGTLVLTTTRAFNQRHFIWPLNSYCVTGAMTSTDAEWPSRPVPPT